ncbi:MAG: sigma factor-like helix-turn-helix DNA-binding protein [Bacilli bacterium]|nr:sigma factor-like helix-turn-helix DNA-binding protein [Bacilli bacterium]
MEYRIYIINLYDIYSNLLTDKQKEYFEDYYYNNLTLSEMSENYNISRNGIYKQIKDSEDKLKNLEDNLHIYEKNKEIKELIKDLNDNLKEKIIDLL